MSIALRPAESGDQNLIRSLFNLYQNDLSEYCGDFTSLDENGYFDPNASKDVLPFGNGVYPYIIAEDGRNLGLVIVTDSSCAPAAADWYVAELYLIRAARGRGIAGSVMRTVFEQRKGIWSLLVYQKNAPARAFWDRIIAECGEKLSETPTEDGMNLILFHI